MRNRNRAGAKAAYLNVPACRRSRAKDMRTSVITFDTRARQRFYSVAQQVALHARPGEAGQIDKVVSAVHSGALSIREGHACLSALRRNQQAAA